MIQWRPFKYALVLIVVTAITGFIGFIIVYHFATIERPLQHFAIVIDAGSTQTRSNLFSIDLDMVKLDELVEHSGNSKRSDVLKSTPLEKVFHVKQIDSCINGGPLTDIQSSLEARALVRKCIEKFSLKIKLLDLKDIHSFEKNAENGSNEAANELVKNIGANSVTHLYLGATAGMRSLNLLSEHRARERIDWMDRAINESRSLITEGPFINKGYVGIITGSEEAAFGWLSVNFVGDQLKVEPSPIHHSPKTAGQALEKVPVYETEGLEEVNSLAKLAIDHNVQSIGSLELGGASAQMAYEVAINQDHNNDNVNIKDVELFNEKYKLATRSDLCLGMSQAVLRIQYILLRDIYENSLSNSSNRQQVDILNPCFQNQAIVRLSKRDIRDFLNSACLVGSEVASNTSTLNQFLINIETIQFKGSGDMKQCEAIMTKLLEPQLCKQHFLICPKEKNLQHLPKNMPFVTVSGYNYVLSVLNLTKAPMNLGAPESEITIASKLGGNSIDYQELVNATEKFCSQDVRNFPQLFPKISSKYQNIICLQLVYVRKLLTEFYLIDPKTDQWKQIKFLIFPVAPSVNQKDGLKTDEPTVHDKSDIGWTLGLLLNSTSLLYSTDEPLMETIFYHQASSVFYVLRAIIFLMFACILMAVCLITIAIISTRHHQGSAYINHE